MADLEDVQLLESGSKDLQRCDFKDFNGRGRFFDSFDFEGSAFDRSNFSECRFANCNFKSSNLVLVDFSKTFFINCVFEGFALQANFQASTFEGGAINLLFDQTNLQGARFLGVDVKRSRFKDGNNLEDAIADIKTDFDGIPMPRALSKLPIFHGYTFAKGMFNRVAPDGQIPTTTPSKQQNLPSDIVASVRSNMIVRAESIHLMSLSLVISIDDFIANHPTPNDPEKLDFHNSYLEILKLIREGLVSIETSLKDVDKKSSTAVELSAAEQVVTLKDETDKWWTKNKASVVDYGASIGLLGFGTAILTLCGAPPIMATGIAAIMSNSQPLIDYVSSKEDK